MSVQNPIYIFYGVILDYKEVQNHVGSDRWEDMEYEAILEQYTDNAFKEDSVNAHNDMTLLIDGMDGKYIALGHVTQRSGPYGEGLPSIIPIGGNQYDPTDPDTLVRDARWLGQIETSLLELGWADIAKGKQLGWYVITHYR